MITKIFLIFDVLKAGLISMALDNDLTFSPMKTLKHFSSFSIKLFILFNKKTLYKTA